MATGSLSKTASTMFPVRFFPFSSRISLARGRERAQQKKERRTAQLTRAQPRKPLEFLDEHPGGSKILKRFAGKNATKAFWKYHGESVLEKYGGKFKIGTVKEAPKL